MKVIDIYNKPLKDVLETLNLVNLKIHTDEYGDVKAVELKYMEIEDTADKTKSKLMGNQRSW